MYVWQELSQGHGLIIVVRRALHTALHRAAKCNQIIYPKYVL